MLPKLYTGKEISEILRISKALAYKLMSQGDIPTIHFSHRTVRVRQEDLEEFISRNMTNSQGSMIITENSSISNLKKE